MRRLKTAFGALIAAALAACGPDGKPASPGDGAAPAATAQSAAAAVDVVSVAAPYSAIDLDACLRIARNEPAGSGDRCPGFISASLVDTIATCAEVGGELVPLPQPSVQALDVNGDGLSEFLYDVTENYYCDGAPSILSCGSRGCPVLLAEQRDGAWHTIGYFNPIDAVAVEVLAPEPGSAYGVLRGGCVGQRPCDELTHYSRDGSTYAAAMIEAGQNWVDVAPGGLWTLVADTPVLAAPSPGAAVLAEFPAGTDVVVMGDARGAPWKYVSPCNACKSGFVPAEAMRKPF